MEQLVVVGGRPIGGEFVPAGNKNEALPCLAAALLTEEPVRIENVPAIADIRTMIALLESVGCAATVEDHVVTVRAAGAGSPDLDVARRIRGSFLLAGPLLARRGRVHLPAPGGDRIEIDTGLLHAVQRGFYEIRGKGAQERVVAVNVDLAES